MAQQYMCTPSFLCNISTPMCKFVSSFQISITLIQAMIISIYDISCYTEKSVIWSSSMDLSRLLWLICTFITNACMWMSTGRLVGSCSMVEVIENVVLVTP